MPWAQYDISTGFIDATCNEQVPIEEIPEGRAQLYADEVNPDHMKVDITQNPHVLVSTDV